MTWEDYAEQYRQVDYVAEEVPPLLDRVLEAGTGSLLDVGCGEGFLLDHVRQHRPDWSITGFEISRYRADVAARRGHHVLVDTDGVAPVEPGSFDVVSCCHVIEHVPDDGEYARYLTSLVRPGGYLYVETPVKLWGGWYFRRNPKAGWVLDPTHVREYRSAEAANAPLRAAGLELVAHELTPIRLSLASAEALVRRVLHLRPGPQHELTGWRAKYVRLPRYRIHSVLARRPVAPQ
jgi:2-polyprenyl-3-methyl-5-hydroxy-6-metoxy-1,4-benzoquinol methylase